MASNSNNHQTSASGDQGVSNAHLDPNNGYVPNDSQLAGLVEAATAAAGQDHNVSQWAVEATAAAAHHQLDGYGADMQLGDDGFGDASFVTSMASGRHLRHLNDHSGSSGLSRTVSKKRKRNDDNLDPALAGAGLGSQQHSQSQQNNHGFSGDNMDIRSAPPSSLSEARAVGVHSAAALFRQPSSNKKYTRPPMSKLFSSLELSPENFLHLQAAAKGYMLDDDHPERRECVGQRGKGDTEMVKLRLWNCVRNFLEAEGNGERFFGEDVVNEGMGPRTYIWPRDQQKIISLVIPLLRRMVTNERQRQYAIETRKGGGTDERRRRKTDDSFPDLKSSHFSPDQQLQMHDPVQREEHRQSMPPPPAPQAQAPMDPNQAMEVGLTDLLLDGYQPDWSELSRCYDEYNHDFQLDNLWSLSGLQQPDWRGLVAAVDSHYQVLHNGTSDCQPGCENHNVNRIIHADSVSSLPWRISGGRNTTARDDFASSITRDVSRIIRENIASRQGVPPPQAEQQFHQQPFTPAPSNSDASPATSTNSQAYLRINILSHGKRIFPRLDIQVTPCLNVETVKQLILRQYPGLEEDISRDSWKVKAWLPDGLFPIQSEKDWALALLSADTVDWMDGEVKLLIEVDGADTQQ
ncbi:Mitochondrial carrier protein RIM2 [Penicillium atrosanguineum]|uniref:Mitochondrial carrier protein RIM2 n=1 Tax=Penicillium atrosanguineum TaxID=1132637 RepID=UPI00238D9025|nr:Mitochondrial carrier protein RIM2 [Penicillium atrosanguineum]KAJ5122800.1 hypothetical protein N7526_009737 [Penicillium atrosanguineum]KAJ5310437.1 Mitochondrial carrier protein RIM2 [Penicillium atrosanguineum]